MLCVYTVFVCVGLLVAFFTPRFLLAQWMLPLLHGSEEGTTTLVVHRFWPHSRASSNVPCLYLCVWAEGNYVMINLMSKHLSKLRLTSTAEFVYRFMAVRPSPELPALTFGAFCLHKCTRIRNFQTRMLDRPVCFFADSCFFWWLGVSSRIAEESCPIFYIYRIWLLQLTVYWVLF